MDPIRQKLVDLGAELHDPGCACCNEASSGIYAILADWPEEHGPHDKRHFYAFSFHGKDYGSGADATASVYIGYPSEGVTMPRLMDAKSSSGLTDKAVLVGA